MQLWDFLDKNISALGKLIAGQRPGRRWMVVLLTALVVIGVGTIIEHFTGFAFYGSLRRQTALLTELSAVEQRITPTSELYPAYVQAVRALEKRPLSPFVLTIPTTINIDLSSLVRSVGLWKFISGASVVLIMMLAYLLGLYRPENARIFGLGALFYGVGLGMLGLALPIIFNPWVNYIGFPLLQFILAGWYGSRASTRTRSSSEEPRTAKPGESSPKLQVIFDQDDKPAVDWSGDPLHGTDRAAEASSEFGELSSLSQRELELLQKLSPGAIRALKILSESDRVELSERTITGQDEVARIVKDTSAEIQQWLLSGALTIEGSPSPEASVRTLVETLEQPNRNLNFWHWAPAGRRLSLWGLLPERSPVRRRFDRRRTVFDYRVLIGDRIHQCTGSFPSSLRLRQNDVKTIAPILFRELRQQSYPQLSRLYERHGLIALRRLAEFRQSVDKRNPPVFIDGWKPFIMVGKGLLLMLAPLLVMRLPLLQSIDFNKLHPVWQAILTILILWPLGYGFHLMLSAGMVLGTIAGKEYWKAAFRALRGSRAPRR